MGYALIVAVVLLFGGAVYVLVGLARDEAAGSDAKKARGALVGLVGGVLLFGGMANEGSGDWATALFFGGLVLTAGGLLYAIGQD